jgi:6-phosphogluconolactonase
MTAIDKPEVQVFPSLEEMSVAAASRFEELAAQSSAAGKVFSAALSGRSTPRHLYELLAEPARSARLNWDCIHLFQVDERCVPPNDPESNCGMIREALLGRVLIPTNHFHRMQAERADLEQEAQRYATEIARVLAPAPGRPPRFDLIFLGMGPDGHTASLFPQAQALGEQSRWVCTNYVDKFQSYRLTLTFTVLNAAAELIFLLMAGQDKAETLRSILVPQSSANDFPAQRIQPQHGRVTWFVDHAAARLL